MYSNPAIAPFELGLQTATVELLAAFNELVARASKRTGCVTAVDLSDSLGMRSHQVTTWRSEIRKGKSPLLRNVLPLLEAASVFAHEPDNTRKDER